MKLISHSSVNKILAIICMLTGLYLLVSPFVKLPVDASSDFPSGKKIDPVSSDSQQLVNQPNYLEFLNSSGIKTEIVEGSNISAIDNGSVWRVPVSSSDPNSSNMVIVGHNFTYGNTYPPFRTLPESKPSDRIRMVWGDKIYNYEIKKTEVHSPSDTFIERPTDKPTLTMYTCYPMFMAKERFVVTAERL